MARKGHGAPPGARSSRPRPEWRARRSGAAARRSSAGAATARRRRASQSRAPPLEPRVHDSCADAKYGAASEPTEEGASPRPPSAEALRSSAERPSALVLTAVTRSRRSPSQRDNSPKPALVALRRADSSARARNERCDSSARDDRSRSALRGTVGAGGGSADGCGCGARSQARRRPLRLAAHGATALAQQLPAHASGAAVRAASGGAPSHRALRGRGVRCCCLRHRRPMKPS